MIKRIATAFLIAALAITALLALFVTFFNPNKYKPRLEELISERTGMEFRIKGVIKLVPFPLSLAATDVSLKNRGEEIVRASTIYLSPSITPLLGRRIVFEKVEIEKPVFNLRRDLNGEYNFHRSKVINKKRRFITKLESFVVTGGRLDYLDEVTRFSAEALDVNLNAVNVLDVPGRYEEKERGFAGFIRDVSFGGDLQARSFTIRGIKLEALQSRISCANGVLDASPITARAYGGQAKGSFSLDYSRGGQPPGRIKAQASGLDLDRFFAGFGRSGRLSGKVDLTADLKFTGFKTLKQTLTGGLTMRGRGLLLKNMDLDSMIEKYKKSQNFNLFDLASVFVAGPFGPLLATGYELARVLGQFGKGTSRITRLESDWAMVDGIASARDVAFSTARNRIACKGDLDFVNKEYRKFTVGVLDAQGCAIFRQTLNGPFLKPRIKHHIVKRLLAPLLKLFKKAETAAGAKCEVFYNGVIAQP
jgi:AsmA protein